MEETLNRLGNRSWEQVAALTKKDVARVAEAIDTFPDRIEKDDWIGGAKQLVRAGHKTTTVQTNQSRVTAGR